MEIEEKYLPIGTVVMLKNGKKRVMISGFCAIKDKNTNKVWDYSGCLFPEGFFDSSIIFLFDHDQIEKVYHLGFMDDEESKFKGMLKEYVNEYNSNVKL